MLVTGASGFVGGALLRRLAAEGGHDAVGLSRRPPAEATGTRWCAADLERALGPQLPADLAGWQPEVVVHAAARVSPWGPPARFVAQNVTATQHLLDWAAALPQPPRVVHVSTSSVHYTSHDQLGIREDDPLPARPINAYAATKRAAEDLVRGYAGPWVVLRPRAVIGPGDTHLLPRVLDAARRGALPAIVRDPPAMGDLVDIDTLVGYLLRAATTPEALGRTINVSNGEPVDLQATVLSLLGRLGLPAPTRRVRPAAAMAAAAALEALWRAGRRAEEPPITRYGVTVFTVSKTFDVTACRTLLGPPERTLAEAIELVVADELRRGRRAVAVSGPAG